MDLQHSASPMLSFESFFGNCTFEFQLILIFFSGIRIHGPYNRIFGRKLVLFWAIEKTNLCPYVNKI
jgi:hypothetical protein